MGDVPAQAPARPSWYRPPTPYQPGNTESVTHGAYSPRIVNPLAREVLETMLPHTPWITPADMATLWAWATVEAQCVLLREWLARNVGGDADGLVDVDGTVPAAANLLQRLEPRADTLRSRLGLDPLSRAKLGRDVAASQLDIAQLLAQLPAEDVAPVPVEALERLRAGRST